MPGAVSLPQGAFLRPGGTFFRVWAPRAEALEVELDGGARHPMAPRPGGFFECFLEGVGPGVEYAYRFADGRLRADPASRFQRGPLRGPSTVVDLRFPWTDAGWTGVPTEKLVLYEVHVGTFTPQGTFEGMIERLPALASLGVTAVELMPVAAWDGPRGWGYDGTALYAPHAAYGTPSALQRLVDACHASGLAVILDVVYNHLGPSGDSLSEFGPYFTDRHHTPWGKAFNFDQEGSRPVRDFIVDNALQWVREYHFDGLRLDSVPNMVDGSRRHVLVELVTRVGALAARVGRHVHVIAECDEEEPRALCPVDEGGWGLSAQWADDFHHALHGLLTSESVGYYRDFGRLEDLATAYRHGFVRSGRRAGLRAEEPPGRPGRGLVVAAQNHDQIGNRPRGERLSALVRPEAARLAAAATILSPFIPLLFMGEEYGELAPFQYFTSFADKALGRAVSRGRRRELKEFGWRGEAPDPQAPTTFERSKLRWGLKGDHALMRRYYEALLALRRDALLAASLKGRLEGISAVCDEKRRTLAVGRGDTLLVLRFSPKPGPVELPPGRWRIRLDSWEAEFCGVRTWQLGRPTLEREFLGGPYHAVLLERQGGA